MLLQLLLLVLPVPLNCDHLGQRQHLPLLNSALQAGKGCCRGTEQTPSLVQGAGRGRGRPRR